MFITDFYYTIIQTRLLRAPNSVQTICSISAREASYPQALAFQILPVTANCKRWGTRIPGNMLRYLYVYLLSRKSTRLRCTSKCLVPGVSKSHPNGGDRVSEIISLIRQSTVFITRRHLILFYVFFVLSK